MPSTCQWNCDWELCAVVGLKDIDPEREALPGRLEELDCRALVARIVHLQEADPRAAVDGGELVESLSSYGNALKKLHVHLQAMAWPQLLV